VVVVVVVVVGHWKNRGPAPPPSAAIGLQTLSFGDLLQRISSRSTFSSGSNLGELVRQTGGE